MDLLRREAVGAAKLRQAAVLARTVDEPAEVPDDRLRLIFTCCHPALPFEARGRTDAVHVSWADDRGDRARSLCRSRPCTSGLPARRRRSAKPVSPTASRPAHLLSERLNAVLAVVYLLFKEGYAASAGADLVRQNLSAEAIRLARLLVRLLPESEAQSLLALMLLHDARRSTRVDAAGALVTRDRQDRSRWDTAEIAEGPRLLSATPGPYQLQAAIAACHATAASVEATDWPRIVRLYDELVALASSPVVRLNRAVVGIADGPALGLDLIEDLAASGELAGYHLLPATRVDLRHRSGSSAAAAEAYQEAMALASTDAERDYLRARVDEMNTENFFAAMSKSAVARSSVGKSDRREGQPCCFRGLPAANG